MDDPLIVLMVTRTNIVEFVQALWNGETWSWIGLAVILVVIAGMHVAHKYFGWKPPTRKERRAARERRKIVLWKYERD